MSSTFEQAKAFFLQGLAHYEAQRFEAADTAFSAALSLVPGRPSTLTNLGATRLKLGRPQEALELLREALAQEPDNAQALGQAGAALAEIGKPEPALELLERAVQLEPGAGAAWSLRGTLLREAGRTAEAAGSFEQALAAGADPVLNGYYLAAVREGAEPPSAPPPEYVEQLFDRYADEFDEHLQQVLGYDAPERLVRGLGKRRFVSALDLGCGTGLCAPLLRPISDRLEGVDLSAAMVERARARGLYDDVHHGDIAAFLAQATSRRDLLVAADVFIYVGDLDAVFAAARRALADGGTFCFSAEAEDTQDYALRTSLRYAHSERYIRMLAAKHGFECSAIERHPVRHDQRQPIPGLFVWLTAR